MDNVQQLKIQKYEDFVDSRVKPDLLLNGIPPFSLMDKVFESHKSISDLRKWVEILEKNAVMSLRILVNISSEVYMQADMDTRHIFVDVGLEFHVEFMKVFRSCSSFQQHDHSVALEDKECNLFFCFFIY
ncbi:hypothetical protein MKW98_019571 [Papaver atlanticum]|uniref:Uncharacterized protein n=1 Tax=Papaver atlanticum TaxID=357466 RepID=A0AAD4S8K2_9MAGN|nr:hypothetical protein MKW98_019571 [Papaver atlanticum]